MGKNPIDTWLLNLKNSLSKKDSLQLIIFRLLVFLLPTQLAYHFWPDWSLVWGIRVDYLAPTIYLTDIFVGLLLLTVVVRVKSRFKFILPAVGLLIFIFANTLFSVVWQVTIFKWIKALEFVFLAVFIARAKSLRFSDLTAPLTASLVLIVLIALGQFMLQSSLGFPFTLLGERTFNARSSGIALVSLFDTQYLRSYSIFSHPNSFAGFVVVGGLMLFSCLSKYQKVIALFLCCGVLLSFSRWVGLTSAVVLFLYLISRCDWRAFKVVSWLVFVGALLISVFLIMYAGDLSHYLKGQTILERLYFLSVSRYAISKNFLLGSGLGTFVLVLIDNPVVPRFGWLLQPVHNILVLGVVEIGLVGVGTFIVLFLLALKKTLAQGKVFLCLALLAIVITGLVDHYWITLQQNQLLLSFLFGLIFRKDGKQHS